MCCGRPRRAAGAPSLRRIPSATPHLGLGAESLLPLARCRLRRRGPAAVGGGSAPSGALLEPLPPLELLLLLLAGAFAAVPGSGSSSGSRSVQPVYELCLVALGGQAVGGQRRLEVSLGEFLERGLGEGDAASAGLRAGAEGGDGEAPRPGEARERRRAPRQGQGARAGLRCSRWCAGVITVAD